MADIRNLTVLPRPRTAWQAMDAGFTLARAHYTTLVILWFNFCLPVFFVCLLIQFWLGWTAALLVWWWFKPLYELPMHLYLSRALFSERLSMTATWRLALSSIKPLFASYLTLARLSGARALTYGVVFLEHLPRNQRRARVQTLTAVPTRHYLLMLVCVHIEFFLVYAILGIVTAMFFPDILNEMDWIAFFNAPETLALQPWIISSSLVTIIAAALVAPFYVTGGFLLYINRRMQLEAWDIELRFRKMSLRNSTNLVAAVLLALCIGTSDQTIAEDRSGSIAPPQSASSTLDEILLHDDFGYTKKQWIPDFESMADGKENSEMDFSFLNFLFGDTATSIAAIFKVLLWVAAAFFVGLLLYTIQGFKRPQLSDGALSRTGRNVEDAKSHPLTQDLPTDIVASARGFLAQGKRRQALSVLFRGALRAVMNEYDLKVSRGATESDCKNTISAIASEQQVRTFANLLGVWQKEAYANQPQHEQLIDSLIDDWHSAFGTIANKQDNRVVQSS